MCRIRSVMRLLLFAALSVTLLVGCDSVYNADVEGGTNVATGANARLRVHEEDHGVLSSCGPAEQTYTMGDEWSWSVSPSKGAAIENGVFKATQPGTYTVSLLDQGGRTLDRITITVTGAEPVVEEAEPEEEGPPLEALAGTYKGSFETWAGANRTPGTVDLVFNVNGDGTLTGEYTKDWAAEISIPLVYSGTFTGTVSADGSVQMNGTWTAGVVGADSTTGAFTVTGSIADGAFTGTMVAADGGDELAWSAARVQ